MLISQLPGCSTKDLDELIEFEDAVIDCIGALGIADGHEFGSGERNIFVVTDQPESAYRCIKSVFESKRVMTDLKVAYRKAEGWEYKILYPPRLQDFTVIGDE